MIVKAYRAADTHSWLSAKMILRLWLLILVGVVAFLAFTNLPYAPRTWFDEGSHLHVPKTIVQHGVYADISSEGYRYYGPTVGVGPTVMLPIALMFKLFGVGLLQGRLVIVAYLLIALLACYLIARRLHGTVVGMLALTLLLGSRTLRYEGVIEYGRQVLGEVPGLAYLLLGLLAWILAVQHEQHLRERGGLGRDLVPVSRSNWLILLAGMGFGLALVTKNQFVLIVPPALLMVGLLDWLYYRVCSWRLRIVPLVIACGCFGLWTLAQLQFLGPGSFWQNMQQTRQAAGGAIFVFDMRATLRAGYYVLRPDLYGGLLLPALGYAIWRVRQRNARGLAEMLVVALIGIWLVWFVGASLGWPRYAFPAVALSALTIARMLVDLIERLRGSARLRPLTLAVGCYTALAVLMPLALSLQTVARYDDSVQRFAALMNERVPHDVVVETWEPELGVLTDHRYHYPPIALLDTAVRHKWLGGPPLVYDGLESAPPYVVVGAFGADTLVYSAPALDQHYVLVEQVGTYALFERR